MKKIIEFIDGYRWVDGNTSSALFSKSETKKRFIDGVAILDSEGNETGEFKQVEEAYCIYDELVNQGCLVAQLPELEKTTYAAQQQRLSFKAQRSDSVKKIQVTTGAGNIFDGDEESQTRMARAIVGLDDGELLGWVLADNTQIQVDSIELKEALKLAGAAQAALWV